ncbi:MAG: hypothetical protein AAF557_12840 [Pseudomonadota bacterium]
MRSYHPVTLLFAVALLCGCASDFTNDPELKAVADRPTSLPGQPQASRQELAAALDTVFAGGAGTYVLCEASSATRMCDSPDDGLSGIGLGGLFLPLLLEVDGFDVSAVQRDGDKWRLTSDFSTTVNAAPPICAGTDGNLSINQAGSVSIDFDSFYCNWLVIGNVVTKVDLFLDWIDPANGSFAGAYAVQFNGTGNAFGTGYFFGRRKSTALSDAVSGLNES